ncbi:hypothetical protein OfM1_14080 [Lactovum odontotermitis]
MKSLIILSYRDILKNKATSIVTYILMMFSALLFSLGLIILFNTQAPLTKMFQQSHASDESLIFSTQLYDEDQLMNWWKKTPSISEIESYHTDSDIQIGIGKNQFQKVYLTEKAVNSQQNILKIVSGQESKAPANGTIWLPTSLSNLYNLHVGDTVRIKNGTDITSLKISAVVVDPYFSATMINPKRIWVNHKEFENVTHSKSNETTLAIKYKNYQKTNLRTWNEFTDYLKTPFLGVRFEISLVSYVYNIQFSLIGGILLLFSVVIALLSLFIISSNVKNMVAQDEKINGVLATFGFSLKSIRRKYYIKYFFLGILSFPLGIFISVFPANFLMNSMLSLIGEGGKGLNVLIPMAITVIVLVVLLALTITLATRRIVKLSVVEAITNRKTKKVIKNNFRKGQSISKRLSLSWMISFKKLLLNRKRFNSQFIVIVILSIVLMFSVTLISSLNKLYENRGYWGFSNADFVINSNTENISKNILQDNPDVQSVVAMTQYTKVGMDKSYKQSASFYATVISGNLNTIGQPNLQGRNPGKNGEISLALGSSKLYHKNLGDNISIIINGRERKFTIVGIYQTIDYAGKGFRINRDDILKDDYSFKESSFYVKVKNKTDLGEFKNVIQEKYGNSADITNMQVLIDDEISQAVSGAKLAGIFLSVTMIVVSLVNIVGEVLTRLFTEKKDIGILKSVGFTNSKIISIYLIQNLIVTLFALVLGGLIITLTQKSILNFIVGGIGLGEFPAYFNSGLVAIVYSVVIVIIILTTITVLRRIRKISLRELTSE